MYRARMGIARFSSSSICRKF